MSELINILHVVGAVFVVGPMAILPMTAMRAIRAGESGQVGVLAKSTTIFTWISVVVALLGFALVGLAPDEFDLSVTTPWVLISIVLYAIAAALNLFLVVPTLQRAAEELRGGRTGARYPAVAAGSGIVTLLLVAVTVLMVWKPGS